MTFDLDTLSFSFLFLPAVLLCFTLAPQRCKNGVLGAASLMFYALGDLRFLPLMHSHSPIWYRQRTKRR